MLPKDLQKQQARRVPQNSSSKKILESVTKVWGVFFISLKMEACSLQIYLKNPPHRCLTGNFEDSS